MSGGSMDYFYLRVRSVAENGFRKNTAKRRAFAAHLLNVSKALRAIEWNDSGDGDDSEDAAILTCIGEHGEATQVLDDLRVAMAAAQTILAGGERGEEGGA